MTEPALPTLPGYTLTRPLAAGGMAEVFAATQHSLAREVAVKIMKDGDATLAERFQREARLVAALNHPHIVHIYDVGQLADGRPYLSMELLSGGELRPRLRAGMTEAEARRIVSELAEGLVAVHAQGIVHRDIKPANILFRANGDAVLSDFGIAKAADLDTELTQAGTVVGSPAYSSPEQVSARSLDARSDLYSLGVVLLEMLTGRNPFRGEDYGSTVVNQLQLPVPPLPPALAHWQPVLERLLAKDPAQRFASAAELLAALPATTPVAGTAGGDTEATQVHALLPVAPARRRHLLPGLAAAVLLGALLFWWWPRSDPQLGAWLAQAEARYARDQLGTPAGDSAIFYYRLVLERDPENRAAVQGLVRVALRYGELARAARDKGDFNLALDYVRRGLDLVPAHPDLVALQEELRAQRRERRDGVQKFFDNLLGR